jgi:hypothetical protein
VQPEWPSSRS